MNSEFNINLGKRLRDRRKELKLTQSEVCGDYITRNMLSRIETGDACPSLDTLMYLSEKLNMPTEYFLSSDNQSSALYKKVECIAEIRALFNCGDYKSCVDACIRCETEDSEIYLLKAESELKLAFESMMVCSLSTAEKQLDNCEKSAEKCLYNSERITATAKFYRHLIQSVKENRYPDFSAFSEKNVILAESEFIIFVYLIVSMHPDFSLKESEIRAVGSPIYKNYLSAMVHISKNDFISAKDLLIKVLNMNPGFFTLYFTTQNLELCYKEMYDYKNAYEYAKMRLDLLDKFND